MPFLERSRLGRLPTCRRCKRYSKRRLSRATHGLLRVEQCETVCRVGTLAADGLPAMLACAAAGVASRSMTETFNDLYRHELEVLLSAEQQMLALLPTLAAGTETAELQRALQSQVEGCRAQADLLQRLLQQAGARLKVPVSRGIQALLQECAELLETYPTGNLRDAVMIAHMQRAEHFKIAAYGTLAEYAKLLGDRAAVHDLNEAARAVTLVSRQLGAIGIQVDAEAYVDTRVPGT